MRKTVKEKWVAALISGEYKQCKEVLHDHGKYCCLGVLNHLVTGEQSAGWDNNENKAAKMLTNTQRAELAKLNDFGVPFEMIAGLIDEAL